MDRILNLLGTFVVAVFGVTVILFAIEGVSNVVSRSICKEENNVYQCSIAFIPKEMTNE
jgi:hypothetical protein